MFLNQVDESLSGIFNSHAEEKNSSRLKKNVFQISKMIREMIMSSDYRYRMNLIMRKSALSLCEKERCISAFVSTQSSHHLFTV